MIASSGILIILNINIIMMKNKIVFTNGCFDILHQGHIDLLTKAKELGDVLIVGLNSDASVKRLKGETRPINDQETRALLLSSLLCVDEVIIFDDTTPLELIRSINPDVLVKGGDYNVEDIVGYDYVIKNGGVVLTINLTEGYSTTNIIKNVQ